MEQLEKPHHTEAGTPMFVVWDNPNDREGNPCWGAPAPTLETLRWLREPEFEWTSSSHVEFFHALLLPSVERRIAESHRGLLKAAATTVAKLAIDTYCKACRESRVFIWQPYLNLSCMIEPLIDEMLSCPFFKAYAETQLRFLARTWIANSECSHRNPSLMIGNDNELSVEDIKVNAIREYIGDTGRSSKAIINRTLDIITLYKKPEERIIYRSLETVLTGASRVLYVIENRAY